MNLHSLAIKCVDFELFLLDQTKLPHQEIWEKITTLPQMIAAIKELKVRGAPLIGVSAALFLAVMAKEGASFETLKKAAQELFQARPTAVNLMWAMDRMILKSVPKTSAELIKEAEMIFHEDVRLCLAMTKHGADFIHDGDGILTHCNTGGLATAGIGTALGVIRKAHEQGKKIHVYVDETRPLLQGGRLTAFECEKLKIPYTLICDNMAAVLMAAGKIHKAFVGADRVAANGDFANKIGTYNVAVLCHYHGLPFYPVAPYSTIDPQCASGKLIPIEMREENEVRGAKGSFGEVVWAPKNARGFNPAFDVTPATLITSFIFDHGVFNQAQLRMGAHLKS
jgi:methylthioribose-1-phosphate isomerase